MNELLKLGQDVQGDSSGLTFRIRGFLGGGSQGEVYRASAGTSGGASGDTEVAVKWFYPRYIRQDKRLRERIDRSVHSGAPSDHFLWPAEIAAASTTKGFGYVMALREPRFHGMSELVTRQVEPTIRALATAGFELASAFLQLHARGLCYRDISFGNVFFDPATGEVKICDNDNVDIDGQPGAITGTARFMAPELVTGAASPSTQSDLFSLAVLLFYLLVNHHPLEGAHEAEIHCFDLPAMTRLYGSHPVFIFDPDNATNRPVAGLHDNALAFWPLYPHYLRALFTRAFTDGVRDPQHGRVRESEWRAALAQLRDYIFYCSACAAENMYDPAGVRVVDGTLATDARCWACDTPLRLPPRIRITRGTDASLVMLNHDTALYRHHVDGGRHYAFDAPAAQVRPHPSRDGIWGLANLSDAPWTATTAAGETITVPPGKSATLKNGLRIHFGPVQGEIRL